MIKSSSNNPVGQWRSDAALVALALMWGTSHVVTKSLLAAHPPSFYTTARFGIASICFVLLFWRHLLKSSRGEIVRGMVLGLLSFAGIVFYVAGLAFTQASKAGFITGLYIVFTPLVAYAVFRLPPTRDHLAGMAVAVSGYILLSYPGASESFNRGDLLVLMAAAAWATHIAATTAYAANGDVRTLAVVQVFTVAILALAVHSVLRLTGLETRSAPIDSAFLWQIGYIAIVVTCLASLIQTWAQKQVSSTHAAIVYALEPVSAAVVAYLALGERLDSRRGFGAILILAGVTISRLRPMARMAGGTNESRQPTSV